MYQKNLQMNRRGLLVMGASGVTVALAPSCLMAMTDERPQTSRATVGYDVRYVITDQRFTESLAFAAAADHAETTRLEVTEGLTKLWQEHLVPLWQSGAGAVTGLTTRSVWECLAEQARSYAFRTQSLTQLTQNDGRADSLVSWIIA